MTDYKNECPPNCLLCAFAEIRQAHYEACAVCQSPDLPSCPFDTRLAAHELALFDYLDKHRFWQFGEPQISTAP